MKSLDLQLAKSQNSPVRSNQRQTRKSQNNRGDKKGNTHKNSEPTAIKHTERQDQINYQTLYERTDKKFYGQHAEKSSEIGSNRHHTSS